MSKAKVIDPQIYRALAIRHGLLFYHEHRRPINRGYTPKRMLAAATSITGIRYRIGQYQTAAADIAILLALIKEQSKTEDA